MFSTLRCGTLAVCLSAMALPAASESLSFKEARKALPNGKRIVAALTEDAGFLAEKEQGIVKQLEANIPFYGALALTPSEGLYVDWLNAAGQHHSIEAARAAALAHCEANRKPSSEPCVVVYEVAPRGAKADAPLSLSAEANAALRKDYRKLRAPKGFAISKSKGTFGFAAGDGARALDACAKSGEGASDCEIVVAD